MRVYQFRSTKIISILVMGLYHEPAAAQCSGVVSNPNEALFMCELCDIRS